MLPVDVVREMLMKLKFEHGIVLTSLEVDWKKLCVASEGSSKEFDCYNPEIKMSSILEKDE